MKNNYLVKCFVAAILVVAMTLNLCACNSKSNEVKEVEELIDSIGEVSFDSEEDILVAEERYSLLSDSDKDKVENAEVLENARQAYDGLFERIHSVEEAINVIGDITYDSDITIAYAEDAFNDLSNEEQELVNNLDILVSARTEYDELVVVYEANLDLLTDALYSNMFHAGFIDNYYTNEIASSFCDEWESVFDEVDMDLVAYNPDLFAAVNALQDDVDSVVSLLRRTSSRSSIIGYTSSIEDQVEDIMYTYLRSHIDRYNSHYSNMVDPL